MDVSIMFRPYPCLGIEPHPNGLGRDRRGLTHDCGVGWMCATIHRSQRSGTDTDIGRTRQSFDVGCRRWSVRVFRVGSVDGRNVGIEANLIRDGSATDNVLLR